jgi:hypothetical protein
MDNGSLLTTSVVGWNRLSRLSASTVLKLAAKLVTTEPTRSPPAPRQRWIDQHIGRGRSQDRDFDYGIDL